MAVTNSFPHGAFPEHSLECMQQSDGELRSSLVQQQCDSFVELGVVCKNYEDLRNECSRTSTLSTLSTNVQVTTELPTSLKGIIFLLAPGAPHFFKHRDDLSKLHYVDIALLFFPLKNLEPPPLRNCFLRHCIPSII